MPKQSTPTTSDDSGTQPVASSSKSRAPEDRARRPKYLRMTNPPRFDIANTDCPNARVPSHLILSRGWDKFTDPPVRNASRVGAGSAGNDETVIAPVSDEANRVYWKVCIGTYMVHYMKHLGLLGDEWDLNTLWRLRKFPAGYELYAKHRQTGKRTPDQYLFGFDRQGERVIMFDSPYVFVLHGVALACGSTRKCPCSVCDDDTKQTEIRKMLLEIAPDVSIPGVTTFKKNVVGRAQRASPVETTPAAPAEGEEVVKAEPEEIAIKAEPEEIAVKEEVSHPNHFLTPIDAISQQTMDGL